MAGSSAPVGGSDASVGGSDASVGGSSAPVGGSEAPAECVADGEERCDGEDNDCNGVDDDPFANLGAACTAGVGACAREGTYVCSADQSASECSATAGAAVVELCANASDDDCDGETDEAPDGKCCDDGDCSASERCGSASTCVAKTWCELQAPPAGVAASDFRCADFEAGLPGAPWVSTTAGQGQIAASSARASSAPGAVRAQVNAETTSGSAADRGQLSWSAVGATNVTSVSIAADINQATSPGLVDDTGWVDVLCITNSTREYCLSHVTSTSYTGLQVVEKRTMTAPSQARCTVAAASRTLPLNTWTRVELRVSTTGAAALFVGGVQAAISGCSLLLSSESTANGLIGLHADASTGEGYTAFYDNVVVTVRR